MGKAFAPILVYRVYHKPTNSRCGHLHRTVKAARRCLKGLDSYIECANRYGPGRENWRMAEDDVPPISTEAQDAAVMPRPKGLDSTVTAFDADGNHYYRKIGTGIKRGEFTVERAKDGTPYVYQKAKPTGLNVTDLKTGKPCRHEFGDTKDLRLCWPITEAAYAKAREI